MAPPGDFADIKKRRLLHWLVVVFFLLFVILLLRVRITHVSVMGNKTYDDDDAISLIFSDYWDSNTALCLINNLMNRKKSLPFIADYDIVLTGPFSCDLIVYEKTPVGCIQYMGDYMYFDRDGIVIESSSERVEGVPVINGVDFGHIVLGQVLPVTNNNVFSDVMTVTGQLSTYNIGCEAIFYSDDGEITVTLEQVDIRVELGTNKDISSKISVLNDMLPNLLEEGLSGTLYLDNYSETGSEDAVSFRIDQESSQ